MRVDIIVVAWVVAYIAYSRAYNDIIVVALVVAYIAYSSAYNDRTA